jgi:hypothetical protein
MMDSVPRGVALTLVCCGPFGAKEQSVPETRDRGYGGPEVPKSGSNAA